MVPEGWYQTRLGNLFSSRREKGIAGLPTLSVTLTSGLVRRDSLERKTETNLSPNEHLLVRKGDIAYNMMRMWQGASGLAHFDALVSPAYVVLQPSEDIDPTFASHFLKSDRLIYLLWAYSYGLTKDRLRLYFDDFSMIPVTVPSLEAQRRIGAILSTWDREIKTVEKLIDNSERQKRALMQQLLTGNKRLCEVADEQWRTVTLKDIADIRPSNVDKKTHAGELPVRLCNYTDVYYNAHIASHIGFMDATATESEIEKFSLRRGDVIITKDSETPDDIAVPAFVDAELDGVLCGYHLALLRPHSDQADGAFLSSLFSLKRTQHYFSTRANGATRFGLTIDAIRDAAFSIPTLEEQRRIAAVMRICERELDNQREQLAHLKREKTALMQQLLTGKRRVSVTLQEVGT